MRKEDKLLTEIYDFLFDNSKEISLKDILEEKKAELGIKSNLQLSKILGIDKSTFERILSGKTEKIDLFSLLKINQFLGIGMEKLSQIYVASLEASYIAELEDVRKANYIFKYFDLQALKKIGFIQDINDFKGIEKKIITFFGLNSIFEYDREIGEVLFSRTKNISLDKMRDFWVRSAVYQFEKINNPNQYDPKLLSMLIPKIRSYTRNEKNGFLTVIQALYNAGITVIVQAYLSNTQVRGGTFIIENKPCIVITNFNKTYPTIWFALMHELYHVLYDFEDLKTWKYHLTGENDIHLLREEDADYFAREILFPQEKMNYIKHMINSPTYVNDFAEKLKVHPSIIYSFYCWEQKEKEKDVYAFYKKYIPDSDDSLQYVKTNPFQKENIYEEIEKIKTQLTIDNSYGEKE